MCFPTWKDLRLPRKGREPMWTFLCTWYLFHSRNFGTISYCGIVSRCLPISGFEDCSRDWPLRNRRRKLSREGVSFYKRNSKLTLLVFHVFIFFFFFFSSNRYNFILSFNKLQACPCSFVIHTTLITLYYV